MFSSRKKISNLNSNVKSQKKLDKKERHKQVSRRTPTFTVVKQEKAPQSEESFDLEKSVREELEWMNLQQEDASLNNSEISKNSRKKALRSDKQSRKQKCRLRQRQQQDDDDDDQQDDDDDQQQEEQDCYSIVQEICIVTLFKVLIPERNSVKNRLGINAFLSLLAEEDINIIGDSLTYSEACKSYKLAFAADKPELTLSVLESINEDPCSSVTFVSSEDALLLTNAPDSPGQLECITRILEEDGELLILNQFLTIYENAWIIHTSDNDEAIELLKPSDDYEPMVCDLDGVDDDDGGDDNDDDCCCAN